MANTIRTIACPACCVDNETAPHEETEIHEVFRCRRCGAIHGTCYLGESYELVRPFWAEHEVGPELIRYYDLTCLGSKGIERRHGWYDPKTRRIVQVG